jgi:nitrogen fixation protein NifZ
MNRYEMGDLVYAAHDLFNEPVEETGESAIPDVAPDALLAPAGTRGVIVNVGQVEAMPEQEIYLVRFETGPGGNLGEPIGCLSEELLESLETVPVTA